MVAADDHVKTTVNKLAEAETNSEGRIAKLEAQILTNVESSMKGRLDKLERQVSSRLKRAIGTQTLVRLDRNLTASIEQAVSGAGRHWRWPFLIIILLQGAAAYYAVGWWKKFKKTHML